MVPFGKRTEVIAPLVAQRRTVDESTRRARATSVVVISSICLHVMHDMQAFARELCQARLTRRCGRSRQRILRDMREFSYHERMTTEEPRPLLVVHQIAGVFTTVCGQIAGRRRLDSGTVVQDTAHLTLSADSGFSGAVVCPECLRSSATPGDQPKVG